MKKLISLLLISLSFFSLNSYAQDWKDTEFYSSDQVHKLSDYKGKIVLVMFWATWCPHCKNQMPAFSLLKKLYSNVPDLEMLNISIDSEGESVVKNYLNAYNLNNLDSYTDVNSKLLHSFGFEAIPTLILLSKDGDILGYYGGLQEFDVGYLDEIIKKNGRS